jgi:glycosyltransferase involved in cell wall biosynthesis
MKVAVYTIALNEEKFVERWFNSAKDADYLLIADTGSSDNTVEAAKKLGINVHKIFIRPWRFDDARNAALSLIPEDIDYCVSLDMDEVLVEGWREHLEQAFEEGITRPRYIYTWSWKDPEGTIPDRQFGGDKIHKRFGYRWKHPVHEIIVADRIEEVHGWTNLELNHYADPSKPRSQYLPLLKLAVEEDPSGDRNAHYYARELFFHGRLEESKEEFLKHLSLPSATWKPERAASMRYIAKASFGKERENWLIKAVKEAPDRREALTDLAEHYYSNQEWGDCLKTVEKALKIQEKPMEYLCEERSWGSFLYDIGSIAAFSLHKNKLAVDFGEKAIELSPEDERLKKNMEFFLDGLNE